MQKAPKDPQKRLFVLLNYTQLIYNVLLFSSVKQNDSVMNVYIDMYIHFLQVGRRAWLLEVMAPESVCLDFSPDSAICFLRALGLLILPQGQDFLTV